MRESARQHQQHQTQVITISSLLFFYLFGVFFLPDEELQRNWAEKLCFGCTCLQLFWPRVVMRKWLNISAKDSDYSADPDSDPGSGSDSDYEQGIIVLLLCLLLCSN